MSVIKFIAEMEHAFDKLQGVDILRHPEISMISQGFQMLIKNVVPKESKSQE